MRFLTLNIRLGAGGGRLTKPAYDVPPSDKRDTELARAIQSVGPDIVALQEVRNARHAAKIADQLGMNWLYTPHPSSYSLNFFEWGLALLFCFRLVQHGNFAVFFDLDVRTGRNGLWARFAAPQGSFTVMNVHLEVRQPSTQIETLAARAARIDDPLVLMGDFNIAPDDNALVPLKEMMIDTCHAVDCAGSREAEALGTLRGDRRRIDQIWAAIDGVHVREAGLLPPDHRGVSDHVGFFADVEVKG